MKSFVKDFLINLLTVSAFFGTIGIAVGIGVLITFVEPVWLAVTLAALYVVVFLAAFITVVDHS